MGSHNNATGRLIVRTRAAKHSGMIKSINGWTFAEKRPVDEAFQLARAAGFDGFEVVLGAAGTTSETHLTLESTREDCERLRDSAARAGIKIVSSASGLGWSKPMTSQDETVRRAGIEAVRTHLQLAHWLGTDAILVVPGAVGVEFVSGFQRVSYETAYKNASAAVAELKADAEALGVTIAIENVWNKFLLSPLEMRDFVDRMGSARVGTYFDVGNVLVTGYPDDWIHTLGSRISRVHFKDFKRDVGTLAGFCDLLDGDVDYPAVMKALREVGYDNAVTAEFFGCEEDLGKISGAMDKILAM